MKSLNKLGFALLILLLLVACDKDKANDSNNLKTEAPIGNLSGTWKINAVATSPNSSCNSTKTNVLFTFKQNGNALTVIDPYSNEFTGAISGNKINWSGSYPEGNGTTSEQLTGTVNTQCTSVSGSTTWSYSEPGFSCNGTSTFTATRTSSNSSDCNSNGGGTGTGNAITESEPNPLNSPQVVNVPITINGQVSGNQIAFSNGTNPNPVTLNDLTGFISGEDYDAFEFTPSSNGIFNFLLETNSEDLDLYVFFLPTGELVKFSVTNGIANESIGNIGGGPSSTYIVVVTPWEIKGSGNGNYTLSISQQ